MIPYDKELRNKMEQDFWDARRFEEDKLRHEEDLADYPPDGKSWRETDYYSNPLGFDAEANKRERDECMKSLEEAELQSAMNEGFPDVSFEEMGEEITEEEYGRSVPYTDAEFEEDVEFFNELEEKEHQNYMILHAVLIEAYDQARKGKGRLRHAKNRPFMQQPIMEIQRTLGNNGFPLGQCMKKCQESSLIELTPEASIAELLDAIVYLAAAILYIRETDSGVNIS